MVRETPNRTTSNVDLIFIRFIQALVQLLRSLESELLTAAPQEVGQEIGTTSIDTPSYIIAFHNAIGFQTSPKVLCVVR